MPQYQVAFAIIGRTWIDADSEEQADEILDCDYLDTHFYKCDDFETIWIEEEEEKEENKLMRDELAEEVTD